MRKKRIVVIGGGTGSRTVLTGLKGMDCELTAVVAMSDDGGSSGRLRDELGQLPPGDVRQCLVALADDDVASEGLRRLFDYRFTAGNGLNGHSVGNLMLSALTEITGSADAAILEASRLLRIRGRVLPVTLTGTTLKARLSDGSVIEGESRIDRRWRGMGGCLGEGVGEGDTPISIFPHQGGRGEGMDSGFRRNDEVVGGKGEEGRGEREINLAIAGVYLEPEARVFPPVLEAISEADAIVIGPGDIYTSVLPNFLVDGVAEAVRESSAVKIHVCNLMTKPGESDGFRASDFLRLLSVYMGVERPVDYLLANDGLIPEDVRRRYELSGQHPVEIDEEESGRYVRGIVKRPMTAAGYYVRHNPPALAEGIMDIVEAQSGASRQKELATRITLSKVVY